jgi:hypothetical protein
MANFIGQQFKPWVAQQIKHRQKVLGSTQRTPEEIMYMNNMNSWVRIASSVDIEPERAELLGIGNLTGAQLAKRFVLLNTLSTPKGGIVPSNEVRNNPITAADYSYGLGSSEYGYTPPPGIDSLKITHTGRGAVRDYSIKLLAQNKTQLDLIETLYLRLGFTLLIEWGHVNYFDTNTESGDAIFTPSPISETPAFNSFFDGQVPSIISNKIISHEKDTAGNYGGALVTISNYTWDLGENGTYDITIKGLSKGSLLDSISLHYPGPNDGPLGGYKEKNVSTSKQVDILQSLGFAPTDNYRSAIQSYINRGQYQLLKSLGAIEILDPSINVNQNPTTNNPNVKVNNANNSKLNKLIQVYKGSLKNSQTPWQQDSSGNNRYKTFPIIPEMGNDQGVSGLPEAVLIKFKKGSSDSEAYYITLGFLLRLIKERIIPLNYSTFTSAQNNQKALEDLTGIDCNYDNNYMFTHFFQNSADPGVCLIPFKTKNPDSSSSTKISFLSEILSDNFRVDNNGYAGKLMTIHINTNYIESTINKAFDAKSGTVNIVKFLSQLMDGIKNALGNINNFSVTYNERDNSIKIYDDTKIPGIISSSPDEGARLRIDGVEPGNEGSFVLRAGVTTGVTPALTTQIAIGANTGLNNAAPSLANFNKGLKDRTKANISTPNQLPESIATSKSNYFANAISAYTNFIYPPSDVISSMKTDLENILIYDLGLKCINKALPGKGYLPFDLTLEVMGLSGIDFFEEFSVSPFLFPQNYNESLSFQVMSIDHTIVKNQWTTSYKTLATPALPSYDINTSESSDDFSTP